MRARLSHELVGVPRNSGRGPSLRALAILALSALALIATSPGPPSIESRAIGEVQLRGGESTERELRIHLEPTGGGAVSGSIRAYFQAASGLESMDTRDATLTIVSASDAAGAFPASETFPVDRCVTGCDLTYRLGFTADPDMLPGSVLRYSVTVWVSYDYSAGPRDQTLLRVDLEGQATGPITPIWSLLAGLLALVGGIAAGPMVIAALGPRRRRWPAFGLVLVALALIGWTVVSGIVRIANFAEIYPLKPSVQLLVALADPWSIVLHATLGWGVWRGIRRWPIDGGWLLGLAAVALVGLGGLWLAWWSTLDVVIQPVLFSIPFVLLGGVGGIVIGQAWRAQHHESSDRSWGAVAIISHGILIAGFGFLAERWIFDPFGSGPVSLLTLVPAAFLVWAFRRWLRGRQRWLVFFDIVIALAGLLGLTFWFSSTPLLGSNSPSRFEIGDLAVLLAVAAAVVAFFTSLHKMEPHPGPHGAGRSGGDTDPIDSVRSPTPGVAGQPTT